MIRMSKKTVWPLGEMYSLYAEEGKKTGQEKRKERQDI